MIIMPSETEIAAAAQAATEAVAAAEAMAGQIARHLTATETAADRSYLLHRRDAGADAIATAQAVYDAAQADLLAALGAGAPLWRQAVTAGKAASYTPAAGTAALHAAGRLATQAARAREFLALAGVDVAAWWLE